MSWESLWDQVKDLWPHLAGVILAIDLATAIHVVLYKRDNRAAIGWVGIIWFAPLLGALLYVILGINRVQRRARGMRRGKRAGPSASSLPTDELSQHFPPQAFQLVTMAKLVGELTGRPLLDGNEVVPLVNGDEAYPEMLRAIDAAQRSVAMATYIFDNDRAGHMFTEALARAVARGVAVRVLIDDVGARYTWPSIERALRAGHIRHARFMRTLLPLRWKYANLRNHRKILVVDGSTGFTGGLNIREGHDLGLKPAYPIQDLHFRLRGPVVAHLQDAFADDWEFTTGETLDGDSWACQSDSAGTVLARGITTGPDRDIDKLRIALLGAIACAESSIAIVSPYFLPDETLILALDVAALRGVQVDIVLPAKCNLMLVQWASTTLLSDLLQRGVRIWLTPPPFDHAKLMVVDRVWSLIGSANWDPRSLRLNFEFNVECYDTALAGRLRDWIDRQIASAKPATADEINHRPWLARLRDGIARLFTPYL